VLLQMDGNATYQESTGSLPFGITPERPKLFTAYDYSILG